MTFYIVAAVACILLSAFFSASEMALSSANRMRLENLMEDGSKAAAMAVKLLDKFDRPLSTILIGNNFVNIALSSLASMIAITAFGEKYTWLATLIVTVTVIIFGETIPKIVAKEYATRLSTVFAPIIWLLAIVMTPIVLLVMGIVKLLTLPMKGEAQEDDEEAAVEELQSMIEAAEDEDVIDEDRSELLQAALDFNDISAFEVMTARVDVEAIDIDDDQSEILETVANSPYSRLPVYEDSIDNIIGILSVNHYLKELVDNRNADIRGMLMKPYFVYKTVKLPVVLEEMRRKKTHLAIVTDEYGGTLGVISMEDVLEELVGDIWDETDTVETEVLERASGEIEVDGDMTIDEFLELVDLEDEPFETESLTVGGWTIETFGGFPEEGQSFEYGDMKVTVLKMDGLRVERILVKKEDKE